MVFILKVYHRDPKTIQKKVSLIFRYLFCCCNKILWQKNLNIEEVIFCFDLFVCLFACLCVLFFFGSLFEGTVHHGCILVEPWWQGLIAAGRSEILVRK